MNKCSGLRLGSAFLFVIFDEKVLNRFIVRKVDAACQLAVAANELGVRRDRELYGRNFTR